MKLHRSERILLPPRIGFIFLSLFVAFILNLLPWGRAQWVPDFVAITLVFWCTHQPRMVGMGIAWCMGLLMDVNNASLFGQHALSYTVLAYLANSLSRRLQWFPLWQQALHILPIFLIAQLVTLAVRLISGALFPGWMFFASSFFATLLWPLATYFLLMPQKQPLDVDKNRPI